MEAFKKFWGPFKGDKFSLGEFAGKIEVAGLEVSKIGPF